MHASYTGIQAEVFFLSWQLLWFSVPEEGSPTKASDGNINQPVIV